MNIQQHLKVEFDLIFESYKLSSNYSGLAADLTMAIDQVMNPEPAHITMRFFKDEYGWMADIKDYPGPKANLAMVEGADTFLDLLSNNGTECVVHFVTSWFEGCDVMTIRELYELGGAIYEVDTLDGKDYTHILWLCDVTKFVFQTITMPHKIYFKKIK